MSLLLQFSLSPNIPGRQWRLVSTQINHPRARFPPVPRGAAAVILVPMQRATSHPNRLYPSILYIPFPHPIHSKLISSIFFVQHTLHSNPSIFSVSSGGRTIVASLVMEAKRMALFLTCLVAMVAIGWCWGEDAAKAFNDAAKGAEGEAESLAGKASNLFG